MTADRARAPLINFADIQTALLSGLHAHGSTLDVKANDYEFAKAYNLSIDRQPLTGETGLDGDFEHLREVYEDDAREQVLMAGAQTGKTARVFVRILRVLLGDAWGQHAGYYFPDAHLPREYSNTRFRPFVKSNPHTAPLLGATRKMEGGGTMQGRDATESMTIGESHLHFLTIAGKTATEGMPLRATFFDEVRRMNDGDIERAHFRRQGQRKPFDMKVSTAGFPETDIHRYFLQGDQRFFHTACECADGIVLAERWPDCVMDLANVSPQVRRRVEHAFRAHKDPLFGFRDEQAMKYTPAAYYCPTCGAILPNPRNGWWQPRFEGRYVHSYQMPGMLSVMNPAGLVLDTFRWMVDQDEFNKSMRGMPSVNPDKMPIQNEHIDANINPDIEWGEELTDAQRRRRLPNCGMGIDVQAGYGVAVLKKALPSGKHRVVHVEVLRNFRRDGKECTWWQRAGELMQHYDVRCCVVDQAPEFTAAKQFADAFPGRVFLADFTGDEDGLDTIVWPTTRNPKQKGETGSLFRVRIARTKGLHWSLHLWKNRRMEIPPLRRLRQTLPLDSDGQFVPSAHLRNGTEGAGYPAMVLRDHLTRFVFRDIVEDASTRGVQQLLALRQGKKRWVAEWIKGSPDLAFADLYCNVALERHGPGFQAKDDVP